ncbi:MAG: 6-bladed beta-propeller [Bryobacteraceae bacterium]
MKLLVLAAAFPLLAQRPSEPNPEAEAAALRTLITSAPKLALTQTQMTISSPAPGFALDFSSSVTIDRKGTIYLFQRGDKADPILAVDHQGKVLRSWGKGLYTIPHSIRVDRDGSIWTVDSGSSKVHHFTAQGKQLLQFDVGEMPEGRSAFRGANDIAFGRDGLLYISDGYGNARVVVYDRKGNRVRQWGKRGTGPGEFVLPHGIAIDRDSIVYVADRENGRIQRFHLDGSYIGEWRHLGKTFSISFSPAGDLWIGTQPRNNANGVGGWLVKVDRSTGKPLGWVETKGHHSIELDTHGEIYTGARPDLVLWFRKQ